MALEKDRANFCVRRAEMSDMEAILDISRNIYYGLDTLHVTFPSMIQSENNNPYVGVLDGKVVAFVNYSIINDGRAMVSMCSRVADEYQSQGLYTNDFSPNVLADMMSKHPSVKHIVYTTLGSKGHDRVLRINKGRTIIHSWNILLFTSTIQGIQAAITDLGQHEEQSRPLSTSESLKLIQDGSMVSMFKSKFDWFVCTPSWLPLPVTAKNLTFAVKTSDVTGTFENGTLSAVSFVAHTQAAQHPLTVMHLTCDTLNQCLGHIQAFLRHALKISAHINQQINLIIHFPSTIEIEGIQDQLVPHLGQTVSSQFRNNRTDGVLVIRDVSASN